MSIEWGDLSDESEYEGVIERYAATRDPRDFEPVSKRWFPRLHRFFRLKGCSREDAEDLVQVVLIEVLRHAHRFDARRGTESAWILTIADRRHINWLKDGSRRPFDSTADLPERPTESTEAIAMARMKLQAAVEQLEDTHRAVAVLRMYGLSMKEISRELAIPVGTVKTRLFRVRQIWAPILADFGR